MSKITKVGVVKSNKMDKTAVVSVERLVRHPLYTRACSSVVKPGRILYEMEGVTEEQAREAMRLAGHKLPLPTKFVTRFEEG